MKLNKLLFILFFLTLNTNSFGMDSMEGYIIRAYGYRDQCHWPSHFEKLWCPEIGNAIEQQELLNHPQNIFWKKVSEVDTQETKNKYLSEALKLEGGDPAYPEIRRAIACTIAAGAHPTMVLTKKTVLIDDYYLTKFALEQGANPNEDGGGCIYDAPLHSAKTLKMAQLLIKFGANIHHVTKDKSTILHSVILYFPDQINELISYYIEQGININTQNEAGWTPLMTLSINFKHDFELCLKALQILLKAGADRSLYDQLSRSFFHLIKYHENLKPEQLEQISKILNHH